MKDTIYRKLVELLKIKHIIILLISILLLFLIISISTISLAKPGTPVSILFGLINFTKDDSLFSKKTVIKYIMQHDTIIKNKTQYDTVTRIKYVNQSLQKSPTNCSYQVSADEGTMRRIIEAESEAVIKEDISIIKDIFASDAIIKNVTNGQQWNDPISFYENKFNQLSYSDALNFSLKLIRQDGDEATLTSASKGNYVIKNDPNNKLSYSNPPGSNKWILKKDNNSCWKISQFSFR